jgi:glutamyl-tRNA reductase
MQFGPAEIIAAISLAITAGSAAVAVIRRLARGSFATIADVRALEMTMTTTHQLHSSRITAVEHANEMLGEKLTHFPDWQQFDELKGSIAELREQNAVVKTKLEELPRMREAIEDLAREIRENKTGR